MLKRTSYGGRIGFRYTYLSLSHSRGTELLKAEEGRVGARINGMTVGD